MNLTAYFQRIHYTQPVKPDAGTLRGLQRAHMQYVPFENLDIGLKRPIKIDETSIWEKLIQQKRGGFCYELNGLFGWLLNQIGYEVTHLNARDYHEEDDSFGIDFDHLTLLVHAPGEITRWLVDVGWGDTFTQPSFPASPKTDASRSTTTVSSSPPTDSARNSNCRMRQSSTCY